MRKGQDSGRDGTRDWKRASRGTALPSSGLGNGIIHFAKFMIKRVRSWERQDSCAGVKRIEMEAVNLLTAFEICSANISLAAVGQTQHHSSRNWQISGAFTLIRELWDKAKQSHHPLLSSEILVFRLLAIYEVLHEWLAFQDTADVADSNNHMDKYLYLTVEIAEY